MRITVEITREQHEALSALSRGRGLRGFSQLVQEALDAYLHELSTNELDFLLSLEGSLSEDEERELRGRIEEARGPWRVS